MNVAPEGRAPVSIDDDIALLTEQMAALKNLGQRADVDDEEVYDLSIRWGTALAGRLPRMAHYSSIGLLTEADERRFQSVCDELRELAPLVARFKLSRPDLADRPDARASGRRHRKKRTTPRWRLVRR